jgi:hypothetical protein
MKEATCLPIVPGGEAIPFEMSEFSMFGCLDAALDQVWKAVNEECAGKKDVFYDMLGSSYSDETSGHRWWSFGTEKLDLSQFKDKIAGLRDRLVAGGYLVSTSPVVFEVAACLPQPNASTELWIDRGQPEAVLAPLGVLYATEPVDDSRLQLKLAYSCDMRRAKYFALLKMKDVGEQTFSDFGKRLASEATALRARRLAAGQSLDSIQQATLREIPALIVLWFGTSETILGGWRVDDVFGVDDAGRLEQFRPLLRLGESGRTDDGTDVESAKYYSEVRPRSADATESGSRGDWASQTASRIGEALGLDAAYISKVGYGNTSLSALGWRRWPRVTAEQEGKLDEAREQVLEHLWKVWPKTLGTEASSYWPVLGLVGLLVHAQREAMSELEGLLPAEPEDGAFAAPVDEE